MVVIYLMTVMTGIVGCMTDLVRADPSIIIIVYGIYCQ